MTLKAMRHVFKNGFEFFKPMSIITETFILGEDRGLKCVFLSVTNLPVVSHENLKPHY